MDFSPRYRHIEELFAKINEPNRTACNLLYDECYELFVNAPGSSKNHQAWRGGYLDHVSEVMNLAHDLYGFFHIRRRLPFSLSDLLVVVYVHDLEKPWMYHIEAGGGIRKDSGLTKEARKTFRADKLKEYGFSLTPLMENGLKYVEGIPDSEYTPGERIMGELAAVAHCCDILSARLWYDYPDPTKDTWLGAKRAKKTT